MRRCVRTTLTLDDDVSVELERLQVERREGFAQTVNAVLRAGIAALKGRRPPARRQYRTKPVSLGPPRLKNVDNISEVLAFGEGEDYR